MRTKEQTIVQAAQRIQTTINTQQILVDMQ